MTRKGWCKTAQLILDQLHDGCQLLVCKHGGRSGNFHSSVWHAGRGETVRMVQDTIAERLVDKGYVVEVSRAPVDGGCWNGRYRTHDAAWRAIYRLTTEHEDSEASALRNLERERLFMILLDTQEQRKALSHLVDRSDAATQVMRQLEGIISFCTATLCRLPGAEILERLEIQA